METNLMNSSVHGAKRVINGEIWEKYVVFVDQRAITTYVVRTRKNVHTCSKIFLADTGYTMYTSDEYATSFRVIDNLWKNDCLKEYAEMVDDYVSEDSEPLSKKFTFEEEKESEE